MDILKLNKVLYRGLFFLLLLLLGCDNSKKKIAQAHLCAQDSVMHYRDNQLTVWLAGKESDTLKTIDIYHLREGKILSKLEYTKIRDDKIEITTLPDLHTDDILKFIINDDKTIYAANFRNEPKYGGKNFLGCYFSTYVIDGVKYALIDGSGINLRW